MGTQCEKMVTNILKFFCLMTMRVFRLSLVSNNVAAANNFAHGEETDNLRGSYADQSPLLDAEGSCAVNEALGREVEGTDR